MQLVKLSLNRSIERTHSCRFSIFYKKSANTVYLWILKKNRKKNAKSTEQWKAYSSAKKFPKIIFGGYLQLFAERFRVTSLWGGKRFNTCIFSGSFLAMGSNRSI